MAEKEKREKTKKKKKKEKLPLDTETTIADMNVEGFSWYDPKRKNRKQQTQLSKKEYWALVRGAYRAMLPLLLCIIVAFGLVMLIAYLWLK